MPQVANSDSAIQVILSDLWNLLVASSKHRVPAPVQNGIGHSVGDVSGCESFDRAVLARDNGAVSLCHSGFATLWAKNLVRRSSPFVYAMGSHMSPVKTLS
jgi:hypothetical protein